MLRDELCQKLGEDMHIERYTNEDDASFYARLIFSGLACWANKIAQDTTLTVDENNDGLNRVSKNHFTIKMNEVLHSLLDIFPESRSYFADKTNGESVAVNIRKIYENLGNFICDGQPRFLRLANYGRVVNTGRNHLSFGCYKLGDRIIGLGCYKNKLVGIESSATIDEVLLRENTEAKILVEQLFKKQSNEQFNDSKQEYQFLLNRSPRSAAASSSWGNKMDSPNTLVSCIMQNGRQIIGLAHEENERVSLYAIPEKYKKNEGIEKYEYNRLVLGIKAYNGYPQKVYFNKIDENYFELYIGQDLPYREYLFLQMLGWPKYTWHNRYKYIIPNGNKETVEKLLSVLNVSIKEA